MPMQTFRCEAGHEKDAFVIHHDDHGCQTQFCKVCKSTMAPVITYGQGLCYFEEGRERRIWNLERADEKDAQGRPVPSKPVYVRSAEEHRRLMRQRGVDWATQGVGIKGQWI